jgi:hypothetical protein
MFGFLDRMLRRWTCRTHPLQAAMAAPRLPHHPAQKVGRRHGRPTPTRAFWISVDPLDMRRAAMAGTPREVCEVLDQLLAMQEIQHAARAPG